MSHLIWEGTQWLGLHRKKIGPMVTRYFLGSWLLQPGLIGQISLKLAINFSEESCTGLLGYVWMWFVTSKIHHIRNTILCQICWSGKDNHPQGVTWQKHAERDSVLIGVNICWINNVGIFWDKHTQNVPTPHDAIKIPMIYEVFPLILNV